MMLDKKQLRSLTRELRNASRIERTPAEVAEHLFYRYRRPQSALKKILGNRDLICDLAIQLRDPSLEGLPSSDDLTENW